MKKNLSRKLQLHRETVARLGHLEIRAEDLDKVDGGSIVVLSSTVPRGCQCPVQTSGVN